MSLRDKKRRSAFVAGLLLVVCTACSPLEVCYADDSCASHERCYKGEEENSAQEGICLAPSCEPACPSATQCIWDTLGWEAHCVAV